MEYSIKCLPIDSAQLSTNYIKRLIYEGRVGGTLTNSPAAEHREKDKTHTREQCDCDCDCDFDFDCDRGCSSHLYKQRRNGAPGRRPLIGQPDEEAAMVAELRRLALLHFILITRGQGRSKDEPRYPPETVQKIPTHCQIYNISGTISLGYSI